MGGHGMLRDGARPSSQNNDQIRRSHTQQETNRAGSGGPAGSTFCHLAAPGQAKIAVPAY